MYIVRNKKDETLRLFKPKPVRIDEEGCWVNNGYYGCWIDSTILNDERFDDLTWNDEPMEVGLFPISDDTDEEFPPTIRLTTYYEDYDGYREWFFNMLKHQPHYMDCADEEREEIWENHIHKEYDFDEIWNTVQCEGYTLISLKMNHYECQPHYVKVCESKEYIDNILKKYEN